MTNKPYDARTDLEKCQSQWWKLTGLHNREEWSAALVRAATAAEIACNFAIRTEFASQGNLRTDVVDKLLHDANGIQGKIDRLLGPLVKGTGKESAVSGLKSLVKEINEARNDIIHRGEFSDKEPATKMIETARRFVEGLVCLYEPGFKLQDQTKRPTDERASHSF
jgi:hypothetical protein